VKVTRLIMACLVFTMKKKWFLILGAIALVGTLMSVAFAANPVKLIVNGQEIKAEVPPQLIDGRTMVPVRWVAEAMNADVSRDEENNYRYYK